MQNRILVILGLYDLASNIVVSKNYGSRIGSDGRMSTAHTSIIIVDKFLMIIGTRALVYMPEQETK